MALHGLADPKANPLSNVEPSPTHRVFSRMTFDPAPSSVNPPQRKWGGERVTRDRHENDENGGPMPRPVEVVMATARIFWHLRLLMLSMVAAFVLLFVVMYYLGGPLDEAAHAPASFGETTYFCYVTALTIGYGDVVPTTAVGRVCAVMLGLLGTLFSGVTTAVAVSAIRGTVSGR
jgi:voltage-gated potassium channel